MDIHTVYTGWTLKSILNDALKYLDKEINGGKIKVVAKYGIITILDQSYDVCDLVQEIGKQCPIPKGTVDTVAYIYMFISKCFNLKGPLSGSATTMVPSDIPGVSTCMK